MPSHRPFGKINYNPLDCCVILDPMGVFKQHRITLLRLIANDAQRDSTGTVITRYEVVGSYVDVPAVGTGGGINAAIKGERYEQDQIATFYVDLEPGVKTEDALLFARNVFVIEAVSPIGLIPVAWEIHCSRVQHPDEGVRNLEDDVLAVLNNATPREGFGGPDANGL